MKSIFFVIFNLIKITMQILIVIVKKQIFNKFLLSEIDSLRRNSTQNISTFKTNNFL